MLATLLRLGRRSKLAFVDPPKARCNTSRSAGEGAKARKRELVFEAGAVIIREPSPFGFSASNVGLTGAGTPTVPKSGGVLFKRKTLASGFKPFLGLSLEEVENQRRGGRVLSPCMNSSSCKSGSELVRCGGGMVARCMFIESGLMDSGCRTSKGS
jgi:hypothetical protein